MQCAQWQRTRPTLTLFNNDLSFSIAGAIFMVIPTDDHTNNTLDPSATRPPSDAP
jgi:hypothetical protein